MKRLFAYILLAHIFVCTTQAQTKIEGESLFHDEKTVTVTFDINSTDGVPTRYKEVIMPYIYNGKDTLWFASMEVYGKSRYLRERQEEHLKGNKTWELGANGVLAGDVYHYENTLPMKRWMSAATLGIKRYMTGCQCEKEHEDITLLQDKELFHEPQMPARRLPEYSLTDVEKSWNFGNVDLLIKFTHNKVIIDPNIFENAVVFQQILTAVDKIFADDQYRLDHIDVLGYASPEGHLRRNTYLGQTRAEALIDYIISSRPQYNLTHDDFRIYNCKENWDGLRDYLKMHEIDQKDDVISIIDSNITDEAKKTRLKALNGGKVWKELLDEIFPHLRSARFLGVFYDSTDSHATDAIQAANDMIRKGEYAEAYNHLTPYNGDFRAYNSIGVALMMQGEFEEALPWFEKALENGSESAASNIKAIESELSYEDEQKRLIEEYLKKYE